MAPKEWTATTVTALEALSAMQSSSALLTSQALSIRGGAYAALDRTNSLANACRDSTMSITGHTDSSGHESSNQRLSLARASAIANYVAAQGIARERLIIIGAGSSAPIADNTTRYGRSLNRRISILLHDSVDAEQTQGRLFRGRPVRIGQLHELNLE